MGRRLPDGTASTVAAANAWAVAAATGWAATVAACGSAAAQLPPPALCDGTGAEVGAGAATEAGQGDAVEEFHGDGCPVAVVYDGRACVMLLRFPRRPARRGREAAVEPKWLQTAQTNNPSINLTIR